MEKVLILNGSFCELPLIEECHKQGYYVITSGNMPDLVGHKYADEYINADYSDYETILSIVRSQDIRHIVTNANDFGCMTAAYVDEQMGWHHHDTFQNARLLHHKDLFKEYIQRRGYPTPHSVIFHNEADAIDYIQQGVVFPVIVKANDLTGGKGILKACSEYEASAAISNAFAKSRSKHILIEPFITGNQQTFVTFLYQGKVIATSSCDSYSFVNPYLIQAETLPAGNIEEIQPSLISIIEDIACNLKLADGIFALQYIRKGKNFQIIEMMRRPFGNQFLKLVELNSGFPWHRAQIVAETGGGWDFLAEYFGGEQKTVYCGHYGVMATHNGILRHWNVPSAIQKHLIDSFVMKNIGDTVTDYLNERIAYLHFKYDSYNEMTKAIQLYNQQIEVDIK